MSNESLYRLRCREELEKMKAQVVPARNEKIALRAIQIALYFLDKAEKQAMMINTLQKKNGVVPCKNCAHANYNLMCEYVTFWNEENDFCSKGEPKNAQ